MYDVPLKLQLSYNKKPEVDRNCVSPCNGCFYESLFGKNDNPPLTSDFNPHPIVMTVERSYI